MRDFLRNVPLFQELGEEELERLEAICREQTLPPRQVIFREGDPVDGFYLVREGLVTVFKEEKGKPMQVLARLEAGGYFGEIGLLNDKARRVASARTTLPSVLLRIEKEELIELLADNPMLELKFRAEVIRRHGMNVSALLGLAGQRDVRIHLGSSDAVIFLQDGSRLDVKLENISLGGIGLSGVPESWQPAQPVRFNLAQADGPPLLRVVGTVTWKEGSYAGVAFGPDTAGDANQIHRVVWTFLQKGGRKPG